MEELYSTADIWLGGLLLSEADAKLVDVHISRNGRETVTFSFQGKDLSRMAHGYCNKKAKANVARLRVEINQLRDRIFQARKN